jgi:hypothetical protein
VSGDFDGDHRDDILWYGPGSLDDSLWWGRSRRGETEVDHNYSVSGNRDGLAGDFDGDGRTDIYWYAGSGGAESLWWGRGNRRLLPAEAVRQNSGDYVPVVGDFNGDDRADILWYGPGPREDGLWWGTKRPDGDGELPFRPVLDAMFPGDGREYVPVSGDFDGDGRDDILWYGNGSDADALWLGHPSGRFIPVSDSPQTREGRTYEPFVGDFDGDGRSDIFWYGEGANPDALWWGTEGAGFRPDDRYQTAGHHLPVIGDFDGDRRDDVVWYGPGPAGDARWWGDPDGFVQRDLEVNGPPAD